MSPLPDLSAQNKRRSQLSYLLLVGLVCTISWVNRQQTASQIDATNDDNPIGTVQQENNAILGLGGAISDAMRQGIHDSYRQQQDDEAEFNRRFENEQREKQYKKDNND